MNKRPSVIVDVERMKHPFTGLYYFCLHLAENLNKYHSNEFDFEFFKYPGVYFPAHLKSFERKPWHKIFLYKDLGYDIWHGTWQLTKYVPKGKIKFVYTIHDLNFLYTDKPTYKKRRLLEQIQKRIDRADAITTISEYVKQDVEQNLNLRGKKIHVVYNGVEIKSFPSFDQPRYRPRKPFLFSMGTVLYKKHFHVLPALLPGTDFELIIAGIKPDRNYEQQIIKQAEKFGVKDRVQLIGPVSEEEKYWYLKNTEAFLFPSISEGFGLPPVEAMRLGKPVFLSDKTSLPEIGGDVAYYFKNFDPGEMRRVLLEGLQDYEQNNKAEKIRQRSLRFTWQEAAKQYAQVYRNVLGLSRPGKNQVTSKQNPVTAIIPTFNEEENIEQAIDAVSWADEILVIDSFSNDRTVELAKNKGVKVIKRKFDNFSDQKNFAIEQATYDWIFVLDADERIPVALKKEILQKLKNPDQKIAFWIKRQNFLQNKPVRFSGWQNDKCIRLFHRKYARYNGHLVHEEITASGEVGMLSNKMLHFTFKDKKQFAEKLAFYSRLKALEWKQKGKKYSKIKQIFYAGYRFFKHFFLHFGFLDGKAGWEIAKQYAIAAWNRYENLKKFQKQHGE